MSLHSSQEDLSYLKKSNVTPSVSATTIISGLSILYTKKRKITEENPSRRIDEGNLSRFKVRKKLNIQKTRTQHHIDYLQRCIGTKCAPSYAIIFMDYLESRFLRSQNLEPIVWCRFIDDIFMIWPHNRQELNSFMAHLNQFHDSIKFTFDVDSTTANFLDVQITKDNSGYI